MVFIRHDPCARRRFIETAFAAVALTAGAAVTPIVAAADGWAATYGPLYGGVLPWAITVVQVAVTPYLLIGAHRRRTTTAMVAIAVIAAGLLTMATGPAELYATYVATTVWVPVASSSVVPVMQLGDMGRRRTLLLWSLLAAITLLASRPWAPTLDTFANGVLHVTAPALIGLYLVLRRRMLQSLRDRADRAEREQHLLAERARADERARLASEMHDIVSHRVSLMVLQAGALRMNAADDPTRTAAEELRATGCQALDELRDLVGVLRKPPPGEEGERPVPDPEPQTPDLEALVADGRAAGLDVTLRTDGDPGHTAPVVARTVHRVAREALTNAGKHAHGAAITVDVRYDPERVHLTVRNTTPPGTGDTRLRATGGGSGLIGLRQRVEVVGGAFTAGPDDDGGFTVAATLPLFVSTSEPAGAAR